MPLDRGSIFVGRSPPIQVNSTWPSYNGRGENGDRAIGTSSGLAADRCWQFSGSPVFARSAL
ncbi:hypothetical protein JJD41_09725 [Oxynema sp. CENA135]|nr:hypothetical protein [Oxynema sp. CENA135]